MGLPVTEGAIIATEYAISIAELAEKYNKPVSWVIEALKESLEKSKEAVKTLS